MILMISFFTILFYLFLYEYTIDCITYVKKQIKYFPNYLLHVIKIKRDFISRMIVYDIRVGDFIQLLSIFFFIDDVNHVSRSVSSFSMMTYRRKSIGTITDLSMDKIMIIEKIQILKIDMDINTILKDYHEK